MGKVKISVSPLSIIEKNRTVRINCNKVLIQNKSNYIVYVFRNWSLNPGASLEMGSEDNSSIIDCDMQVDFEADLFDGAQPDVKRVEVLQMHRVGEEYVNVPEERTNKEFFEKIDG